MPSRICPNLQKNHRWYLPCVTGAGYVGKMSLNWNLTLCRAKCGCKHKNWRTPFIFKCLSDGVENWLRVGGSEAKFYLAVQIAHTQLDNGGHRSWMEKLNCYNQLARFHLRLILNLTLILQQLIHYPGYWLLRAEWSRHGRRFNHRI